VAERVERGFSKVQRHEKTLWREHSSSLIRATHDARCGDSPSATPLTDAPRRYPFGAG
jgi:hypothetical protein